MKPCPNCKEQAMDEDTQCPRCGVYFDKWIARAEGHTVTLSASGEQPQLQQRDKLPIPWIPIVFCLIIVGGTAAAYWYLQNTLLADPAVSTLKVAEDLNVDPGKPEQIYIAYRHAVTAGDLEILKILTASNSRQPLLDSPEAALAGLKGSMPAHDWISSAMIENGRAVLKLEGRKGSQLMRGQAEAVIENGLWKIEKVEWRFSR